MPSSNRVVGSWSALALFTVVLTSAGAAVAKTPIAAENDKPVDPAVDSWLPPLDPTTFLATSIGIDGVIDGYPSAWSVKNGDVLGLRVSTTAATYRTRIYRLGWYAASPTGSPVGSRLVWEAPATAGERQPFPAEDGDRGLAEASWHDSLAVTIPCDWVGGAYVARFTTDGGKDAYTYFFVRDDTRATKAPILFVDTTATAQAYNPWPKLLDASGKQVQGKSTYAYNSAGIATKASGEARAVAISFDRPHGENWGLGIFRDWGVPMIQWLEKQGYDVAYAESRDLHAGAVLGGRRMFLDSGHDEYWSAKSWDNLDAARDAGVNLAFFSGNDFTWQVRFEPGSGGPTSTMAIYKGAAYPRNAICGSCFDWGGDPEFQLALAAKKAGDTAGQVSHLKNVTYGWSSLSDFDVATQKFVAAPVDVARYAMEIEGLFGGPKLPECAASAPATDPCNGLAYVVENSSHWIYTGAGVPGGAATGLTDGDRIPHLVGYEMDSAYVGRSFSMRPATQVRLAWNDQGSWTGLFNAQYYDAPSGAKVFSAGTINWSWGLERGDLGQWGSFPLDAPVGASRVDKVVSGVTANIVQRMADGTSTPIVPAPPAACVDPIVVPDAGVDTGAPDTGSVDTGALVDGAPADTGTLTDAGVDSRIADATTDATTDSMADASADATVDARTDSAAAPDLGGDALDSSVASDTSDASSDVARNDSSLSDSSAGADAAHGDGSADPDAGSGDTGSPAASGCGCHVVDGDGERRGADGLALVLGALGLVAARRRRRVTSSHPG